jgi:hypothetical protein
MAIGVVPALAPARCESHRWFYLSTILDDYSRYLIACPRKATTAITPCHSTQLNWNKLYRSFTALPPNDQVAPKGGVAAVKHQLNQPEYAQIIIKMSAAASSTDAVFWSPNS